MYGKFNQFFNNKQVNLVIKSNISVQKIPFYLMTFWKQQLTPWADSNSLQHLNKEFDNTWDQLCFWNEASFSHSSDYKKAGFYYQIKTRPYYKKCTTICELYIFMNDISYVKNNANIIHINSTILKIFLNCAVIYNVILLEAVLPTLTF